MITFLNQNNYTKSSNVITITGYLIPGDSFTLSAFADKPVETDLNIEVGLWAGSGIESLNTINITIPKGDDQAMSLLLRTWTTASSFTNAIINPVTDSKYVYNTKLGAITVKEESSVFFTASVTKNEWLDGVCTFNIDVTNHVPSTGIEYTATVETDGWFCLPNINTTSTGVTISGTCSNIKSGDDLLINSFVIAITGSVAGYKSYTQRVSVDDMQAPVIPTVND